LLEMFGLKGLTKGAKSIVTGVIRTMRVIKIVGTIVAGGMFEVFMCVIGPMGCILVGRIRQDAFQISNLFHKHGCFGCFSADKNKCFA